MLGVGLLYRGGGVAGGLGWSVRVGLPIIGGSRALFFCCLPRSRSPIFFMAFSHSGDTSLPSSLFILTPGGAILMYSASFTRLWRSSVAVSSTSTWSHSMTWPSFQACSATADLSNLASLQAALCSFILMLVLLPVSPM